MSINQAPLPFPLKYNNNTSTTIVNIGTTVSPQQLNNSEILPLSERRRSSMGTVEITRAPRNSEVNNIHYI